MDKGFSSVRNINEMVEDGNGLRVIIALPFTMSFAKKQVTSESKDIDTIRNILYPLTKEQKAIYKAFSIDEPV
jgi:hypothetical protein